uniref:Histidine-rich glycoprotein n=1 Tax=Nothoprocta perdicaria TaxID=30464 RepID=A0A8C6YUF5_NOTPE
MKLLASALFLAVLQFSPAHSEASVTPADCDTIETDAGVALDLVNRHRRDGYVFGLFRVVDAYKQDGNSSVLYLTLDVLETECSVLSGRPWASCEYSTFQKKASLGWYDSKSKKIYTLNIVYVKSMCSYIL